MFAHFSHLGSYLPHKLHRITLCRVRQGISIFKAVCEDHEQTSSESKALDIVLPFYFRLGLLLLPPPTVVILPMACPEAPHMGEAFGEGSLAVLWLLEGEQYLA